MVKVPLVPLHAGVPLVRVHVPVIVPPVSVVPLSVPVTVPFIVSVFPEACTVKVNVPVTASVALLNDKTIVPVGVSPVAVKHRPSVRNWKKVTLRLPSPLTVNWVVKLSPEASPAPPNSCALQPPLAAVWAVAVVRVLLLPQPVDNVNASNNRTATTFVKDS